MPEALILYHYFHPDNVVSARIFSELGEGLRDRGWGVTAMPCNRARSENADSPLAKEESWNDITIRRIWRPDFRQTSGIGRVLNAIWMICAWSLVALNRKQVPDIVIIGTDPILGILASCFWKKMRPRVRVVHWCFDLYPDAAIADGLLKSNSALTRAFRSLLRRSLDACDLVIDIGACMRQRIQAYTPKARLTTIAPWGLTEPAHPLAVNQHERESILGHTNGLALMYSGSMGRAHSFETVIELARKLRRSEVRFVFSIQKERVEELLATLSKEDTNITCVQVAQLEQMEARLSAADIQVVTLRPEWTGTVVPSKFFGALAVGRPVLFAGSRSSAIGQWILEHAVGWVLEPDTLDSVAKILEALASNPEQLNRLFRHCHNTYQAHFTKTAALDRFDKEMRSLLRE